MDLSKLTSKISKTPQRKGRGCGSGWGKTAGRGNNGAGQRSGKKLPYIGFNGGNIPFVRKLPKRGFNIYKRDEYQLVNLADIQVHAKGKTALDPKVLCELGLIGDETKAVKILARIKDAFSLKVTVKADKFSQKAKQTIEGAGGTALILERS
ncbi:MAG: 50S ribosomal protein L15 [Candidatus Omnitrophota bacterium]